MITLSKTVQTFKPFGGLEAGHQNWVIFNHVDDETFSVWPHEDFVKVRWVDENRAMGATPQLKGLRSIVQDYVPK